MRIYLDHNATAPLLPAAREAMLPFLGPPANPSSAHREGARARAVMETARADVAALIGAAPGEIVFTSGATEANNLALFGLTGSPPGHILASPIEHPCVTEPLKQLAARGFEVRHTETLREHYSLTLSAWLRNLEANWERAVELVGLGRARVWRLYIAASAVGFELGRLQVHQVLAVRADGGQSGFPLRPAY